MKRCIKTILRSWLEMEPPVVDVRAQINSFLIVGNGMFCARVLSFTGDFSDVCYYTCSPDRVTDKSPVLTASEFHRLIETGSTRVAGRRHTVLSLQGADIKVVKDRA